MRLLNRGALIGAACAAVVLLIALLDRDFFGLERLSGDALTRSIAARTAPDPSIVIAAINQKTLDELEKPEFYGRWPWTREVMARVVETAHHAGARAIVFDVSFAGASDPTGDERFARALQLMPVILAVQSESGGASRERDLDSFLIDGARPGSPSFHFVPPYEAFRPAAIGTIRLSDPRRYLSVDRIGQTHSLPSLGLATASVLTSQPIRLEGGDVLLGERRLDIDDDGTMLIRWHGQKQNKGALNYPAIDFYKFVVASALLEQEPDSPDLAAFSKELRGKIIVVGATAQGLLDLRSTPLSPTSAGVEIHANALDSLLHDQLNRSASPLLVALALLLLCALGGAILFNVDSYLVELLAALTMGGAWTAAAWLGLAQRWVIPTAGPLLAIAATYVAITIVSYVAEQQKGLQLKSTFGRYVSPQILDHILAHPEKVELGGDRRDMTILFSDIRGFTSISEASEPEEVVEMLNEYLTEMVEILLRHGGTLDKFIGDAVMGFWNAPADDRDHAEHAVACAVEMIEATTRIRERWEQTGKASIRIGIGINTGEAVVGNIGSKQVFGYTVIGDAVNLASRLESKNKDYATEIIISEMTLERVPNKFETKYLDEVKVKGKEKAVKIYEVKGRL